MYHELPFSLNEPSHEWILPKPLKEISGLTILDNGNFATVNDEKGLIYVVDTTTSTIASKIKFGKNDDYESIVLHKDRLYVGESNGNIKVVSTKKEKKIGEYSTFLSRRNNVEGMTIDIKNNRLMLACKGQTEKKTDRYKRAIYTFDLEKKELDKMPWVIMDLREAKKELKKSTILSNHIVDISVSLRLTSFAPSGIGIDPITNDVYVISSKGNILVVLDFLKNVKGIYLLPRRVYGQPEGLCFDKVGNLYISNERKSTKQNILRIDRKEIQIQDKEDS